MLNRLIKITPETLSLCLKIVKRQYICKWLLNIQSTNNDPDLPHQINNILIENQLYLQVIDLNQKYNDFYTPVVVLLSAYYKLEQDNDQNIMELT
jgi:hypothetical protein